MNNSIAFGKDRISIEDIVSISERRSSCILSPDPEFARKIDRSILFLDKLLANQGHIYGVTTGYGDSVTVQVPEPLLGQLSVNLIRFLGCGLGDFFSKKQGRAIMGARLASLSQGYSGVSWELLELLKEMLEKDIIPVIPEEGSVGASGDLAPLSYLAGAMIGEREVYWGDKIIPSSEALALAHLEPLFLRPKEGLALTNGTAVMTALACLAFERAEYLTRIASRITALTSLALFGSSNHFDRSFNKEKLHPGQQEVANWIENDLHVKPQSAPRISSRYPIHSAPHTIGVLRDSLPFFRTLIENELNSANDNPIIDGIGEQVLHGGHFYGGHIAMAMDSMKNCVANLADLADRQFALLLDDKMDGGLSRNRSGGHQSQTPVHHGLKSMRIACSKWAAEALKLTMPASVFSRSTECHNQDKVSMGTISARDCLRILQLTEQVLASTLLAAVQGVWTRIKQGKLPTQTLDPAVNSFLEEIGTFFDPRQGAHLTDQVLKETITRIQQRIWVLYGEAS